MYWLFHQDKVPSQQSIQEEQAVGRAVKDGKTEEAKKLFNKCAAETLARLGDPDMTLYVPKAASELKAFFIKECAEHFSEVYFSQAGKCFARREKEWNSWLEFYKPHSVQLVPPLRETKCGGCGLPRQC